MASNTDADKLISELDKLFGNKDPEPKHKQVLKAQKLSSHLTSEIVRLKKKCVDGPKECSSKEIYKAHRCRHHYDIHENALALKRSEEGRESLGADGYVRAYDSKGNWRLKHRIVMEEKLKRPLLRNEIVVFLDKDRSNCDPDNLTIRASGLITCPHCNQPFTLS